MPQEFGEAAAREPDRVWLHRIVDEPGGIVGIDSGKLGQVQVLAEAGQVDGVNGKVQLRFS